MRYTIEVIGSPRPERQQIAATPKGPVTFRSPGVKAWMEDVHAQALVQKPPAPFTGPVILACDFRMPRPQYLCTPAYRKGKKQTPLHTSVRDNLTNLTKCVEDALEGVLFVDDGQVYQHGLPDAPHRKRYAELHEFAGVTVVVDIPEQDAPG